ncbi:MAG: dienelactone hydrolase family protein [Vicinamibacterales bacterium]
MLTRVFHQWERRLASVSTDRVVRPFEWGLDWLADQHLGPGDPRTLLQEWGTATIARSDAFYAASPADDYRLHGDILTFSSALETPHVENNLVRARLFPDNSRSGTRRAVLVMPQWNADPDGHVGLCRLLNKFGITALRLTLPYHDARMPPELTRADYIVSANVGRTVQVCRQAVLDARRAIAWLHGRGYESLGLLGTSLGSCLAMLTAAHEPLVGTAALNHISPYFADVVWDGLSTRHVRQTLEGNVTLDELRRMWLPISPLPFLEHVRGRKVLLIYARYDLTFPVDLSRALVDAFRRHGIDHDLTVLPCGHYSTGVTPFKWMDGLVLCRFLNRAL